LTKEKRFLEATIGISDFILKGLPVLLELSLSEGEEILIKSDNKYIQIEPKEKSLQNMTLKEILNGVTFENIRAGEDCVDDLFGSPIGREIW
jgi:antitoxin component of MazEF toxin-antitoxin module